jgi:Flp pilus assembly protein TadD
MGAALGYGAAKIYVHIPEFVGLPEYRDAPLMAEAVQAWAAENHGANNDLSQRALASFPGSLEPQVLRMRWWSEEYYRLRTPANRDSLMTWIRRVDATDPKNPYGALMEAWLSYAEGHMDESIRELARVMERRDLSASLRAYAYRRRATAKSEQDPASALPDLEEAVRLAPTERYTFSEEATVLRMMGRLDEAEWKARQAVALSPGASTTHYGLGLVLSDKGDYEGALKECGLACESDPGNPIFCVSYARILWLTGQHKEASAIIDAQERLNAGMPHHIRSYNLACFWAATGHRGKTIVALRQAIDVGFVSNWIADDPDLASLHGDPEFEAMVEELRQKIAAQQQSK